MNPGHGVDLMITLHGGNDDDKSVTPHVPVTSKHQDFRITSDERSFKSRIQIPNDDVGGGYSTEVIVAIVMSTIASIWTLVVITNYFWKRYKSNRKIHVKVAPSSSETLTDHSTKKSSRQKRPPDQPPNYDEAMKQPSTSSGGNTLFSTYRNQQQSPFPPPVETTDSIRSSSFKI